MPLSIIHVPYEYPRISGLELDDGPVLVRKSNGGDGPGNRLLIVLDNAVYGKDSYRPQGGCALEGTTAEKVLLNIVQKLADEHDIEQVAFDYLNRGKTTVDSARNDVADCNRKRINE